MNNQTLKRIIGNLDKKQELAKAYALAEMTFDQLKLPHLMDALVIEFNNRYVNVAGTAKYAKQPIYNMTDNDRRMGWGPSVSSFKYLGLVQLSTKYFAVAAEEDRNETVVHEVCHIADIYLRINDPQWIMSNYAKTKGHGNGWRILMDKVGYKNANPCHELDTRQFKSYYMYNCKCGQEYRLTAQLGGRIINQTTYRQCAKCKTIIRGETLKKISGADLIYKE